MIEEMEAEGGSDGDISAGAVYRRLIFLRNQQFVQTEVRLVPLSKSSSKHKKKKKKKGSLLTGSDEATTCEVAQEATLPGNALSSESTETTMSFDGTKTLKFDHTYLDDHHSSIVTCLSLLSSVKSASGILVGLGGGALAMSLRRYFPLFHLVTCEVDPALIDIAKTYFGYVSSPKTTEVIGDGLEFMKNLLGEQLSEKPVADVPPPTPSQKLFDFIVLDADSDDSSLGLTAPPLAFTTMESISTMRRLLSSDGILVINTVARDRKQLNAFLDVITEVFESSGGAVYILRPSDGTVNLTILAVSNHDKLKDSAASMLVGDVHSDTKKKNPKKTGKSASSGVLSSTATLDDLKLLVHQCLLRLLREVDFLFAGLPFIYGVIKLL